jgi:Fungal kinase associated-1 domain
VTRARKDMHRRLSIESGARVRSESRFSIVGAGGITGRTLSRTSRGTRGSALNNREPSSTVTSYDPYRPPNSPLEDNTPGRRGMSKSTSIASRRSNLQPGMAPARIMSRTTFANGQKQLTPQGVRRLASSATRSSIASSRMGGSSPAVTSAKKHKKGVIFTHKRKNTFIDVVAANKKGNGVAIMSGALPADSETPITAKFPELDNGIQSPSSRQFDTTQNVQQNVRDSRPPLGNTRHLVETHVGHDSHIQIKPPANPQHVVEPATKPGRPRTSTFGEVVVRPRNNPNVEGMKIGSVYWKDEARHASAELEVIMDQAFNSGALSPSLRPTMSSSNTPETLNSELGTLDGSSPPSSIWGEGYSILPPEKRIMTPQLMAEYEARPLPRPPLTIADSMSRDLMGEKSQPKNVFVERPGSSDQYEAAARQASGTNTTQHPSDPLEQQEAKLAFDKDNKYVDRLRYGNSKMRAVSYPTAEDTTIRFVPPSSPPAPYTSSTPWDEPLPVRKPNLRAVSENNAGTRANNLGIFPPKREYPKSPLALLSSPLIPGDNHTNKPYTFEDGLEEELQDETFFAKRHAQNSAADIGRRKKWFQRRESDDSANDPYAKSKSQARGSSEFPPQSSHQSKQSALLGLTDAEVRHASNTSAEIAAERLQAMRGAPAAPKKGGWFTFFRKNKKTTPTLSIADAAVDFDDTVTVDSQALSDKRNSLGLTPSTSTDGKMKGVQQNWFAKILNIKPQARVICFTISKKQARREITAILKDWRKWGMKNIYVDRESNMISGKVGKANCKLLSLNYHISKCDHLTLLTDLNIREVSFVAEIVEVREDGNCGHLAMARFTQEKGAASTLQKLVDNLEDVLLKKGLLVTNEEMKREMIKIMNASVVA